MASSSNPVAEAARPAPFPPVIHLYTHPMPTPADQSKPTHMETFSAPRACIDDHLRAVVSHLQSDFAAPPLLSDAIEYALLGGGKRLRPLLAWHCAAAAAADPTSALRSLPAGAAVELVHAFSLVHDDLPAMDDDDLRRGRPTLHKHTDEATAILAGDAMLALAYAALNLPTDPAQTGGSGAADPARHHRLSRELTTAALGMIAGQVMDTMPAARPPATPPGVATIHDLKTGALIRAACRMGAIAALDDPDTDESRRRLDAITTYANAIGRMYQIVDDLLDVTQSADHAGKATGKDAAMGKLTYPAVLGLEGSRAEVEKLLDQAVQTTDNLGPAAQPLKDLARFLARRTN